MMISFVPRDRTTYTSIHPRKICDDHHHHHHRYLLYTAADPVYTAADPVLRNNNDER
jgi:hypothetical protein